MFVCGEMLSSDVGSLYSSIACHLQNKQLSC